MLIILSAAIASIGTYPYANNFAISVFPSSWALLLGTVFFVPAALFANVALGTYSILDSLKSSKDMPAFKFSIIITIALITSLATGFICFVGYNETLSLQSNIIVSLMVTLVNAAIGFSAINKASDYFFLSALQVSPKNMATILKKGIIMLVMAGALLASFIFYFATTNGLLSIADYYGHFNKYTKVATYLFSIVVCLPDAALFINASRITVSQFYDKLSQNRFSFSLTGFFILAISILSGSAYAQMSLEFFNVSKQIPELFRQIASHNTLVLYVIMPIAFTISSLVNAYALSNVLKKFKQ